jgi:hypothetical protein
MQVELPSWPELALFTAAVLVVSAFVITVAGQFPSEHRKPGLTSPAGAAISVAGDRRRRGLRTCHHRLRLGDAAVVCRGDQCRTDDPDRALPAAPAARLVPRRSLGTCGAGCTGAGSRGRHVVGAVMACFGPQFDLDQGCAGSLALPCGFHASGKVARHVSSPLQGPGAAEPSLRQDAAQVLVRCSSRHNVKRGCNTEPGDLALSRLRRHGTLPDVDGQH